MLNVEIGFLSFKHMIQVCVFGFVLKTIEIDSLSTGYSCFI